MADEETVAPDSTIPADGVTIDTPNDDVEALRKALAHANADAKKHRLRNKELEPLAQQLQDIENANKTELEKEREARQQLEAQLQTTSTQLLRREIAGAKGVPTEAVKFLTGTTQEELEASADELLALMSPMAQPGIPRPKEKLSPGGRQPTDLSSLDPGELADRIRAQTH